MYACRNGDLVGVSVRCVCVLSQQVHQRMQARARPRCVCMCVVILTAWSLSLCLAAHAHARVAARARALSCWVLLARADLDEEVLLKQNRPKTSALFTTVLHSEFYTVNILGH